jgi:uncharacterized lipoprotein
MNLKQLPCFAACLTAIAVLNGCAASKDYISVGYTPQANVSALPGAEHVSVTVEVTDVRSIHDRVGSKKNGYGMEMAAIISTNDIPTVVKTSIQQELRNRGFKIAAGDVAVLVELSKFLNDFKVGVWSGDAIAELTMSVQVKKPDGNIIYSKLVTGEGEKLQIQLASGKNAKIALEGALQNAVLRLFSDPLFIDGLVKASAGAPTTAGASAAAH